MIRASQYETARAALLDLVVARGIAHRSADQPILARDGKTSAPWMVDSLRVSLRAEGAALAATCLLYRLQTFAGRQLATLGVTGVPLMQACVMQSEGRFRGAIIREQPKGHGTCRQIEGEVDFDEPIILLDDSISSGTTLNRATRLLEEAGGWVEGAVCLVRFNYDWGFGQARERGYHVESVFDVWEDLIPRIEGPRPANPSKRLRPMAAAATSVAPDLHPSEAARRVMEVVLRTGELPEVPSLDGSHDSRGGVWVSVRDRERNEHRHARDGFWHLVGEPSDGAPADLARAAAQTAERLGESEGKTALGILERSAIAVTFAGPLRACTVGGLDNDRWAIMVRSRERPRFMGGALPRMPRIADSWEQFDHARRSNAGLLPNESYELFRHGITKVIEPGVAWQATGVPAEGWDGWYRDDALGSSVARFAWDCVTAGGNGGEPGAAPEGLGRVVADRVFVSVYLNGRLRGCLGRPLGELEEDLAALGREVWKDDRFDGDGDGDDTGTLSAVVVSLLHDEEALGRRQPGIVSQLFRLGEDALSVSEGSRQATLLPAAASHFDLDAAAMVGDVIRKANIEAGPADWHRHACASWVATVATEGRLEGTLPKVMHPERSLDGWLAHLPPLWCDHLCKHQQADGSFFTWYQPFANRLGRGEEIGWTAHAAWVLARAEGAFEREDVGQAARRAADLCVARVERHHGEVWLANQRYAPSVSEVAVLLLALQALDRDADLRAELRATLLARIDHHGRIATHRDPAAARDAHQDFFPGQLLLALARTWPDGEPVSETVRRALRFYQHRARYRFTFSQVAWINQALGAWWPLTAEGGGEAVMFEIADRVIDHQRADGGVIQGEDPIRPGSSTAVYLEGLAAAARLANQMNDVERATRYRAACARGFAFLDRLTFQDRDAPLLRAPHWARGGVRLGLHRSVTRPDLAQHALSAALTLLG